MAEFTNFDLKKFLAENKQAKGTKALNEGVALDQVMKGNDVNNDVVVNPSMSYKDEAEAKRLALRPIRREGNKMFFTPIGMDGEERQYFIKGDEIPDIVLHTDVIKRLKEPWKYSVSELDGAGTVDALTALIGAGGLAGGAVALSKLMDSLEDGKLGEKGKAVAKFLRDAGKTFSGQGAPMKEEPTVELTREEAFKKQIRDILLSENKSTANSKVVSERKRNIFGMETEGFGDKISNAVSGIGAKLSGGNAAILQKAITASGLKIGTPIYTKILQWDASHDNKVVYTIEKIDYKTGDVTVTGTVDGKEFPKYSEQGSKSFTETNKDILNAEPEKAQQLANEFIQDIKNDFSKGRLSYKPIQSK